MAATNDYTKYEDVLTDILVTEKSVLGFLSAVFSFLARRTDFYYVPKDPQRENIGFLPGVAEQLVLKVLRSCDPKNPQKQTIEEINNEIMCSTVAQEVELGAEEEIADEGSEACASSSDASGNESANSKDPFVEIDNADYQPPVIPTQKNSESYNGAIRDTYSWSQTIMEIDVTMKLAPDIKSSKDLKIVINTEDISVQTKSGDILLKDRFPFKVKTSESFWTLSGGRLLIHLEKAKERWWTRLVNSEEEIDLQKIDCSRPIDELPQDHIDKIREIQWNQEQKSKGLPTSDQLKNIEILKKAWNAEDSPFKGQKFDPNVLMN